MLLGRACRVFHMAAAWIRSGTPAIVVPRRPGAGPATGTVQCTAVADADMLVDRVAAGRR